MTTPKLSLSVHNSNSHPIDRVNLVRKPRCVMGQPPVCRDHLDTHGENLASVVKNVLLHYKHEVSMGCVRRSDLESEEEEEREHPHRMRGDVVKELDRLQKTRLFPFLLFKCDHRERSA